MYSNDTYLDGYKNTAASIGLLVIGSILVFETVQGIICLHFGTITLVTAWISAVAYALLERISAAAAVVMIVVTLAISLLCCATGISCVIHRNDEKTGFWLVLANTLSLLVVGITTLLLGGGLFSVIIVATAALSLYCLISAIKKERKKRKCLMRMR